MRTDARSWLIYDGDVQEAVFRAMEVSALSMCGQMLAKHPMIEVRAVGNTMMKVAGSRIDDAQSDDLKQEAMSKVAHLMNVAMGQIPPDEAIMSEVHAAVFGLDKKLGSAGYKGPGLQRLIARGD